MSTCCLADNLQTSVLADSIEQLQIELPDEVGTGLITRLLKRSLQRFCQDSLIWRYEFEELLLPTGETTAHFTAKEGARVFKIIRVMEQVRDGEVLVTQKTSIRHDTNKHHNTHAQWWYEAEPGLLIMNYAVTRDTQLRVSVALAPVDGSDKCSPEIFELWRDTIEAGALADLYLMPNKNWSNPELGIMKRQLFDADVAKAKRVHLRDMNAGRTAYRNHYTVRL